MTPFTLEPNWTVPKLVRISLAFILESIEPIHLELLSVLFWVHCRHLPAGARDIAPDEKFRILPPNGICTLEINTWKYGLCLFKVGVEAGFAPMGMPSSYVVGPVGAIRLSSSVNGQSQVEPFQKRTDTKWEMISLFALLFHAPDTKENWIFVIEYTFLLHFITSITIWNPFAFRLEVRNRPVPNWTVLNGTVPFSQV